MVNRIKQHVREELAGEVSDWEASWTQYGIEIIAREVTGGRFVREHADPGCDDQFHKVHDSGITNLSADRLQQDLVINVGEEADDIGLEAKVVTSEVDLDSIERSVGAFAATASVAVVNESPFPQRFQDIHERMMYDAIAKRSCADFSPFWIMDIEVAIPTGNIQLGLKLALESQELPLTVKIEFGSSTAITLPPTTSLIRQEQILPGCELWPKVVVGSCRRLNPCPIDERGRSLMLLAPVRDSGFGPVARATELSLGITRDGCTGNGSVVLLALAGRALHTLVVQTRHRAERGRCNTK